MDRTHRQKWHRSMRHHYPEFMHRLFGKSNWKSKFAIEDNLVHVYLKKIRSRFAYGTRDFVKLPDLSIWVASTPAFRPRSWIDVNILLCGCLSNLLKHEWSSIHNTSSQLRFILAMKSTWHFKLLLVITCPTLGNTNKDLLYFLIHQRSSLNVWQFILKAFSKKKYSVCNGFQQLMFGQVCT